MAEQIQLISDFTELLRTYLSINIVLILACAIAIFAKAIEIFGRLRTIRGKKNDK